MMADEDERLTKAWVKTWAKAGPKLEEIRCRELREFKYEDHLQAIDALLEVACRHAGPRTTSGLVEQQRLFQRLRQ